MKGNEMTPSRWERLWGWSDGQSERLNAILIREIRRALNGRFFVIAFLILLALCLFSCLFTVYADERPAGLGYRIYVWLFLSLCGVTFLGLPLMVSGLVHAEIKEKTLELLSITTITAARIVWGELMTALGLFVLFASAVTPFMAFSYLLGGVDLRTIATSIGIAFLISMFLSLVAVLGSLSRSGEASLRAGLVVLAIVAFFIVAGLSQEWSRPLEALWDSPDAGYIVACVLSTYVTLMAILFAATAGRLTFASANRVGPVRAAIAVHLLLMGTLCFWQADMPLWVGWAIYSMCVLFITGFLVIGEEEALSRRLRRGGRLRAQFPATYALFLPGARRGLVFVFALGALVTIMATTGMLVVHSRIGASWHQTMVWLPGLLYAYLVIYLGVSHALCAMLPAAFQRPILRRGVLVVLFATMLLIAPIVCLITRTRLDRLPLPAVPSPIIYLPVIYDTPSDFRDALPITVSLLLFGSLVFVAMLAPLARGILAGRATLLAGSRVQGPGSGVEGPAVPP
jgi:hypothetical protein